MDIHTLFNHRKQIGQNILLFLKDNGYTKNSFAKLINISPSNLNKLIEGKINNISTYQKYLQKIMLTFNLSENQLLNYVSSFSQQNTKMINSFPNNPQTQKMFEILDDIIHLYEIYLN